MMDEGYIKFNAQWKKGAALPSPFLQALLQTRQELYDLKLIGAYENGIGYGNISRRWNEAGQFVISGSATGNLEQLTEAHFTLVTKVDIEHNTLWCKGPIIASSESMSHAVIYRECPWVNAVIHVHHLGMWERLLHQVPTTDASATYGSPEMAYSIIDLLQNTDLPDKKIFAMEGHREGVFVFGEDMEEALDTIKGYIID
jgi:ribulose-5-phosphate 4-epimerase/fuculose-1-phosphate aldolase